MPAPAIRAGTLALRAAFATVLPAERAPSAAVSAAPLAPSLTLVAAAATGLLPFERLLLLERVEPDEPFERARAPALERERDCAVPRDLVEPLLRDADLARVEPVRFDEPLADAALVERDRDDEPRLVVC